MTNRQIGFHLGVLTLLILCALCAYAYFHSRYALPTLIHALEHGDTKARQQAAAGLANLGSQARPAVDALLRRAQPDQKLNDRTSAAGALVEISPTAAHSLIATYTPQLRSGDRQARYEAGMVLTELGPLGKAAIPALVVATHDQDDLVRRWAVTALARIGITTADSLHALIAALRDPSEVVRHDALLAFSYDIVPHGTVPETAAAIRHIGEDPRYAAIADNVLRRLDQIRPVETELWIQRRALKSGGTSRRYALLALTRLGEAAAPAQADIAGALDDERPLNRYLAIEALAAIGPAAAPALPALKQRLQDDDALVRAAASGAIATINAAAPKEPPQ